MEPVNDSNHQPPFPVVESLIKHDPSKIVRHKHVRNTQRATTRSHNINGTASTSISHRLRSVSRAYQRYRASTRSRSNTATSKNSRNTATVIDNNLPYHTIIIDCSPITFVDSMGTKALYQVIVNNGMEIYWLL